MNYKQTKTLLIKFQEWQLNNNILNANFAHNGMANKFLEIHEDKDFLMIEPDELIRCPKCSKSKAISGSGDLLTCEICEVSWKFITD